MNNNQFYVVNQDKNRSSHCVRYINFVIDTSSRAHFKDASWKDNSSSDIQVSLILLILYMVDDIY